MKAHALVRPGSGRWSAVAYVAAFVVLVVLGFFYTNHVQQESERKWCEVVTTLDEAYHQQPPRTELGRKIAGDMARLRRDLGC